MHAMVGGLFSMAGGGRFSSGFLAGGFGDAAGAVVPDTGMIGNTVTASVAGGLGSMLGGGKFANGAVTGAFGYLFNDMVDGKRNDACGGQPNCLTSAHLPHDNGDCALRGCPDLPPPRKEDPLTLGLSGTYGSGVGVSGEYRKGGLLYFGIGFAVGASERPEGGGGLNLFHFKIGDPEGFVGRAEITGGGGIGGGAQAYFNLKGIEFEAGPALGTGGLSGSITGGYRGQIQHQTNGTW